MVGIVQFTVPQTGPQNVPVDSESPTVKPLYLLTLWSLMALVIGNELSPWAPFILITY